jgi:hypothetical protein
MLAEGISTNEHFIDNDQKKSRFNCLSIIFSLQNENEKEKMYKIQTETSNPYYCSSTSSGLTTVEMTEHSDKVNHLLINILFIDLQEVIEKFIAKKKQKRAERVPVSTLEKKVPYQTILFQKSKP